MLTIAVMRIYELTFIALLYNTLAGFITPAGARSAAFSARIVAKTPRRPRQRAHTYQRYHDQSYRKNHNYTPHLFTSFTFSLSLSRETKPATSS